ncbi:uncharacterized protein LOC131321296 [Rhododendron vialii]|uniref:uncharacterized protein LOC131321296 n=1 Tax=Rhododendron vialii TaxID=182163 RepID=UPI00265E158F|nr:uncharacterized protein LOC131321296 [Rhododendron vialii]
MCKAFPSSLGRLGLLWFNQLEAGSIHSFKELERAFNYRFITSNKQAKEEDALAQMRKRPGETLRKYAERYWQLFNEIPGVDQNWAARNFKNGLETGSKILDELAIRAPHGMNELMRTVEQFCSYEEFLAERELQGGQNSIVPQSLHVPTPQIAPPKPMVAVQPKKQVNTVKVADKKGPKAHDYIAETTVFKEPIYFLLRTIEREPFFVWLNPPKLNTEEGNNNNRKRCSYHNELGHYTMACAPYKALLENLAAQGLLDNHIDWTKTPRRQLNAGGQNLIPRPVGVINVIHGSTTKEAAKQLR